MLQKNNFFLRKYQAFETSVNLFDHKSTLADKADATKPLKSVRFYVCQGPNHFFFLIGIDSLRP